MQIPDEVSSLADRSNQPSKEILIFQEINSSGI